jgi:hypothetical protein
MLQNSPLRALDALGLVEACVERGYVQRRSTSVTRPALPGT